MKTPIMQVWSTGLKTTFGHYERPFDGKLNLKNLYNPADILHIYFICQGRGPVIAMAPS